MNDRRQPSGIPPTRNSAAPSPTTRGGESQAPPRRFSRAYRLRRKLRRWSNEFRAQWAERVQRTELATDPVHLNLNHTLICNLRCIMCQQGLTAVPQRVMDRDVYRRVRDQMFDRISEISLTVMGDPFCVPKPFFDEILDDVERYDLRLEMTTNALLFGDEVQLTRLARLLDKLVISIDGATKETFERIRTPAKWSRLLANLERFTRVRRKLPPWRRPLMCFNFVAMRSNIDELPDFVDLAAGWDAYLVTAMHLIEVEPEIAHETLDLEDPHVLAVVAEARRRARNRGVTFEFGGAGLDRGAAGLDASAGLAQRMQRRLARWRPAFNLGLNFVFERVGRRFRRAKRECPFLWNKVYVQIDGTIGTCCHPRFYTTGDLTRQPFEEAWNGKRYRGLRASLNTNYPAASCKDCHLLR